MSTVANSHSRKVARVADEPRPGAPHSGRRAAVRTLPVESPRPPTQTPTNRSLPTEGAPKHVRRLSGAADVQPRAAAPGREATARAAVAVGQEVLAVPAGGAEDGRARSG
ncbi:hypothetical protein [Streptomyces camponoticapitis]|uniref:hypothetical protein n=1 Tax=Streptomyces camponoticapitis TaxID=1616125 RepID=UPI001E4BE76F|nr:hypothetical protein [Streptomyces camponoticapitis]